MLKAMDVEESFTPSEACAGKNTTKAPGDTTVLFKRREKSRRANVHQDEAVDLYRNQNQLPPSRWSHFPSESPHLTLEMEEPESRGGLKHPYANNILSNRLSIIRDEIEMSHLFFRKSMIVCIQHFLIFALTMSSIFYLPIKYFLRKHLAILMVMFHLFVFTFLSLISLKPLRRKFPLNYVFLVMLTISMSYVIAYLSALFHIKVLRVVIPTNILIWVLMALLTCQKRFDISKWFFIIAPASFLMFAFGLISLVSTIMGCRTLWIICCGLLFPHFSVFLLYDFVLYTFFKRFFILPYDHMHFGREAYGIITGRI